MSAIKSFNNIKANSKYGWYDSENLTNELKTRVRRLSQYAKYGGMIIPRNNQIFSLVKTCRQVLGVKDWFLINHAIAEENETIEILNANCGYDRFHLEIRKVSKTQ